MRFWGGFKNLTAPIHIQFRNNDIISDQLTGKNVLEGETLFQESKTLGHITGKKGIKKGIITKYS